MPEVHPAISDVSGDAASDRQFGPRAVLIAVAVLLVLAFGLWPVAEQMYLAQRFFGQVRHVRETIDAFEDRCPSEISSDQWEQAVEWTSNVICQDFFDPNWEELKGLEQLSLGLEKRNGGNVDLRTLQWIWDQCEDACGGPESYGIRFRDLKLLHAGPITDDNVAEVWSIRRCIIVDLSGTEISDASIPFLATLTELERVVLRDTRISEEGAELLKHMRPDCEVSY